MKATAPQVAAAAKEKVDVSGAVSTVHGCSLLAPRGRFDMHALPATDGRGACLALVSNTPTGGALTVPCDDVERVLVCPAPPPSLALALATLSPVGFPWRASQLQALLPTALRMGLDSG